MRATTSRYATTIFCFVLLAHVASNVESSSKASQGASRIQLQDQQLDGGRSSAADGSHKAPSWRNIDLIELTPSLEQQLYQAKRLNNADPGSMIELAKLTSDAYRYEMDNNGKNSQRETTLNNRPTVGTRLSRQVMNGLHLLNNALRLSNSDNYEKTQINNNGNELRQLRFSRGSPRPTFGRPGAAADAAGSQTTSEQDGDYYSALLGGGGGGDDGGAPSSAPSALALSTAPEAAPIGNQEDASRKSLWTSELLRDLLIAQEIRNGARLIEKLARAYEHDGSAHQNSISAQGTVETSEREKRRRCKVDPNLGVKNPSFCDTDAYFGAADYSMRDVWDSAGR